LVNEEKGFYFLSRPRRFGKSLSVSIFKNIEENYQNIIYSVFRLLGAEIHNEVHMNNGRIDSVIVNRNHIYIFEFKMGQPAKVALAQIKEKGYALPYLSSGKPITLIGINFSKKKRNIVEWRR
jgi:ATP-dependent exoDNAse (exonuclease V) beta subunit